MPTNNAVGDRIASMEVFGFNWRDGLRSYQIEAVDAAITMVPEHRRGTIVMACGSGKTIVGVRSADLLAGNPGDSVLVLAPSLALLDQLFRRWAENSMIRFAPLAVCSDDDIGTNIAGEDAEVDGEALTIQATTDATVVADFLASDTDGPKVVFATYHSTPVIAAATKTAGHEWTLAICDEAHRTAGKAGAVFTTVLSNAKVPCQMRLFLTASPRLHGAVTSSDGRELISMDNEAIYGPRLFTYTFGRGIAEGWLSDYRVLVLVVDSAEVYRSIHRGDGLDFEGRPVNAARAASILGLLRAARDHDLSRVIAFHNTISASRHFASDLGYLSKTLTTTAEDGDAHHVEAFHLDGLASPAARKIALAALATPAARTRVVVNNVRVLGEGVDIPALDGVMFAEPKSSQIDVIQAVGRAIRRNPERETPSVVIVPVYLAQGENPDAVMSGSTFKHVWQVLNALRDHDAALDAELAAIRRNAYDPERPPYEPNVLPEKVIVSGLSASAEAFTAAITTMLLDHTTTTWSYGYDRFADYHREHGNGAVPSRYVDQATQFPLGQWVQAQRQAYRWGRLTSEQIAQLEQAGFEWGQRSAQWRKNVALVRTLATGTGSWMTTTDLCFLAPSLAPWFRSVIARRDSGRLTTSEREELSDLCAWGVDPITGIFTNSEAVDKVLRTAAKRQGLRDTARFGSRTGPVTGAQMKAAIALAAQYGLLTTEQRDGFVAAGFDLPPVEQDIDVTQPDWEPAALRHLAETTAASTPSAPAAERATVDSGSTVTLDSLVTGPRGYWRNVVMRDYPETRHGFNNVLPGASALVTDAESRAGRDDHDFIVLADQSVRRRQQGSDEWTLAGRMRDHVDSVVGIIAPAPTPEEGIRDAESGSLTVTLDDAVGDLPDDLTAAALTAIERALVPTPQDLAANLLKSYGVKRVQFFTTCDDADEFIARAHRRHQQPAVITEQIGDDLNQAMVEVRTKIVREALALTMPKVAAAYEAGHLDGWPNDSTDG